MVVRDDPAIKIMVGIQAPAFPLTGSRGTQTPRSAPPNVECCGRSAAGLGASAPGEEVLEPIGDGHVGSHTSSRLYRSPLVAFAVLKVAGDVVV